MKHKDSVLVTTSYHPKPGLEKQFVRLWNKKLCKLSYESGVTVAGIYHNEDTDEFIASSLWPNKELVEKFLNSLKCQQAIDEVNKLCLIPASRGVFEILKEAAA